jgi:hypothetical protein
MRAGEGMLVLDPHGDLWEAARRLVRQRAKRTWSSRTSATRSMPSP